MARFRVEGEGFAPLLLDADNWMSALGDALSRYGLDESSGVECDVGADGDIQVGTARGTFRIHEGDAARPSADRGAEPRLGTLPFDLPSAVDAPDLAEAPAWHAQSDASDVIVGRLAERSAIVEDAETADVACGWALDLLMEVVPAESGAVLLADRRTRDLRFVAARGPRAKGLVGLPVPSGRGIAGLTVRAGVALTVREAAGDPRHYGEVDRRTGYRTHAILSVPIRGPQAPIGCIQLLNPFAGTWFLPWHQTAAQVVAARVAKRIG